MTEDIQPEVPPKKKPDTRSHSTRILAALTLIYEDGDAGIQERLQAIKIATEVLERRPKYRRKTDKEKLIEEALGKKKKTFGNKKPTLK